MRWMSLLAMIAIGFASVAEARVLETQSGRVQVETVVQGLDSPWGLAFLPDGRMLVTERPGTLRIASADGTVSEPIGGLPTIQAHNQGGLLDVVLDPSFDDNRLVYISFVEPGPEGVSTAVARGRLAETRLEDVEVIFRQVPKMPGGHHFGSRLVFADDGTLFITLGERFKFDVAQDNSNHLGTVVRINTDGSVPADNPFATGDGGLPEIWSYGHRNVQGAAIHPSTGDLWTHEFGPSGGDELNKTEAGKNYGWPLVSWGRRYNGNEIPNPPTRPDLASSVHHWDPVISPSGLTFYTGDLFKQWNGNILIGGLSSQALVRLTLDGETVTGEERIDMGERIRNVRQGPDGAVWLLSDGRNGEILRLTPAL